MKMYTSSILVSLILSTISCAFGAEGGSSVRKTELKQKLAAAKQAARDRGKNLNLTRAQLRTVKIQISEAVQLSQAIQQASAASAPSATQPKEKEKAPSRKQNLGAQQERSEKSPADAPSESRTSSVKIVFQKKGKEPLRFVIPDDDVAVKKSDHDTVQMQEKSNEEEEIAAFAAFEAREKIDSLEKWELSFIGQLEFAMLFPEAISQKHFKKLTYWLLNHPCIKEHPLALLKEAELITLGLHPNPENHPRLVPCTKMEAHRSKGCSCGVVKRLCREYAEQCEQRGEEESSLAAELLTAALTRLEGNAPDPEKKTIMDITKEIDTLLDIAQGVLDDGTARHCFDPASKTILSKIESARQKYATDGKETHEKLNAQEIALILLSVHPHIPLCSIAEPHQNKRCSCEKIIELSNYKMVLSKNNMDPKCLYYFIPQLVTGRGIKQDVEAAMLLLMILGQNSFELALLLKDAFPSIFAKEGSMTGIFFSTKTTNVPQHRPEAEDVD